MLFRSVSQSRYGLPVLSVYALHLEGSNEFLVGITIGGYAATQMLLQIPFGIMSDKIGRKITIFIGLVIFLIGSLICAYSETIYGLMIGRFLQGAAAIGAVGTAMISDMVKEGLTESIEFSKFNKGKICPD